MTRVVGATHFGRGAVLGGGRIANVDTMPRDRSVPVRSLAACPNCGAQIGEGCTRPDGSAYASNHLPRRRMALRAERAGGEVEYDAEGPRWLDGVKIDARQAVRLRAGLSQRALGDRLSLGQSRVRMLESGRSRGAGPEGARYIAWLRAELGLAS